MFNTPTLGTAFKLISPTVADVVGNELIGTDGGIAHSAESLDCGCRKPVTLTS